MLSTFFLLFSCLNFVAFRIHICWNKWSHLVHLWLILWWCINKHITRKSGPNSKESPLTVNCRNKFLGEETLGLFTYLPLISVQWSSLGISERRYYKKFITIFSIQHYNCVSFSYYSSPSYSGSMILSGDIREKILCIGRWCRFCSTD